MKQLIQINEKDLPLYDLILFISNTLFQGYPTCYKVKTKGAYKMWDQKVGTKGATFMAMSHLRQI